MTEPRCGYCSEVLPCDIDCTEYRAHFVEGQCKKRLTKLLTPAPEQAGKACNLPCRVCGIQDNWPRVFVPDLCGPCHNQDELSRSLAQQQASLAAQQSAAAQQQHGLEAIGGISANDYIFRQGDYTGRPFAEPGEANHVDPPRPVCAFCTQEIPPRTAPKFQGYSIPPSVCADCYVSAEAYGRRGSLDERIAAAQPSPVESEQVWTVEDVEYVL